MINKKVEQAIKSVLEERFDDVTIESIKVEPDVDDDGDAILRVQVIFDGTKKALDARKASGLLRYMRPEIEKFGENAFPIISFISKSDFRKKNPAAA